MTATNEQVTAKPRFDPAFSGYVTAGEWKMEPASDDPAGEGADDPFVYVDCGDGSISVLVTADWGTDDDLRLMAEAKNLLTALQAVVSVADRKTDEFDRARAAIARALHPEEGT